MMSPDEMDSLFEQISGKMKNEMDQKREEVDHMQFKSEEIDHCLSALREKNKEDQKKTERRLSRLQIEVKALEETGELFFDQQNSSKEVDSKGSLMLSRQLLDLCPINEEGGDEEGDEV